MASSGSVSNLLEAAADHFEQNRPLLPMYFHLVVSALFPIYIGAHASLSRPPSAAKAQISSQSDADEDDNDEEEPETTQQMEGLTPKDAILFPITAGIVLTGLYFAIKHYGADLINLILGVYFSLIGTFSVAKLINDSWATLENFVTPNYYWANGKFWKVNNSKRRAIAIGTTENQILSRPSPLSGPFSRFPLPKSLLWLIWCLRDLTKQKFLVKCHVKDLFHAETTLTRHNVFSAVGGAAAIGYSIFVGKPWWLTNLQGFAVSYGALQLMSPTTFATGTLILSGLFFYDIWAVFFTPLMVTVAKNLDVPIKLVFPRPDEPGAAPDAAPIKSYSMLGLGDIVLPGLMIALALRFDLYLFYLQKQKRVTKSTLDGKDQKMAETIEKAPYVNATGHWGDRFWTSWAASRPEAKQLPAFLTTSFPKTYFRATMTGYIIGMVATLVFMSVFQHAQPALLYLVPAVLLSLWGTGAVRGELKHLWEFSEALDLSSVEEDDHNSDSTKEQNVQSGTDGFLSWLWSGVKGASEKTVHDATKESKTKSQSDKEQGAEDKSKKGTQLTPDTVFMLSIAYHHRTGSEVKDDATSKPRNRDKQQQTTDQDDNNAIASSDNHSDDTVLVSSADVEIRTAWQSKSLEQE